MRGATSWLMGLVVLFSAGCYERYVPRDPELPCHVGVWACTQRGLEGTPCRSDRLDELLEGNCAVNHAYGVFLGSGELWLVFVAVNDARNEAAVSLGDSWVNEWYVEDDTLKIHHIAGAPYWGEPLSFPTPLSGCSEDRFEELGVTFDWLFWGGFTPSTCPRVDVEVERYLLDLVPTLPRDGERVVVPWPG